MKAKKTFAIVIAVFMLAMLLCVPAFAVENHPEIQHSTSKSASVSGEVDKAANADNDMGTQFYMYIPPDPTVNEIPKMGDAGLSITLLLWLAVAVGVAYLRCSHYAYAA